MRPQEPSEDDAGLADKVAIVGGGGAAGDGIDARAAAILLARAGTKVLVIDRDLALAEHTVAMIAANARQRYIPIGVLCCNPSIESDDGAMSTKKRWRKPPPAGPRPEDRFWRRASGGLLGWSGRVLPPDQQMRDHKRDDESVSRGIRDRASNAASSSGSLL